MVLIKDLAVISFGFFVILIFGELKFNTVPQNKIRIFMYIRVSLQGTKTTFSIVTILGLNYTYVVSHIYYFNQFGVLYLYVCLLQTLFFRKLMQHTADVDSPIWHGLILVGFLMVTDVCRLIAYSALYALTYISGRLHHRFK